MAICGADCSQCPMQANCAGCEKTNGCPFGAQCMVAEIARKGESALANYKAKLAEEMNALQIPGLTPVTELYALRGMFVNLEFTLPGGQKTKFWNDNQILLGTQQPLHGGRCCGLAADEMHILACSYGENGEEPEILVYKKR